VGVVFFNKQTQSYQSCLACDGNVAHRTPRIASRCTSRVACDIRCV
jgi:hypothetical protein